jgi:hypothetical protein
MTPRTAVTRGVNGACSAGEGTVTGPLASDRTEGGGGIVRESFGSPGIAYLAASIGPIGREPIVSNPAETLSVKPKSLHATRGRLVPMWGQHRTGRAP